MCADREGQFETQEWSLETKDGRVIQLMDGKKDPFLGPEAGVEAK